jgi:hypothetical protein
MFEPRVLELSETVEVVCEIATPEVNLVQWRFGSEIAIPVVVGYAYPKSHGS